MGACIWLHGPRVGVTGSGALFAVSLAPHRQAASAFPARRLAIVKPHVFDAFRRRQPAPPEVVGSCAVGRHMGADIKVAEGGERGGSPCVCKDGKNLQSCTGVWTPRTLECDLHIAADSDLDARRRKRWCGRVA
eukprot:92225-Prymnesium_polylepis.1